MLLVRRVAPRRSELTSLLSQVSRVRSFHASPPRHNDPRLKEIGTVLQNEFAAIREQYQTPKNPIILAHGLLGFDELRLVPTHLLPGIHYWRGITEALAAKDVEVITATVPPSGSIEKAQGKAVNIIAYVKTSSPRQVIL
jgi:triacylglycerol lipase